MTVTNSSVSETSITKFDTALNASRQALYRYAGLALLDPRTGSWSQLSDRQLQACVRSAAELIRAEKSAQANELALGEYPLDQLDLNDVLARIPDSPEKLNAEFERTFSLLVLTQATSLLL